MKKISVAVLFLLLIVSASLAIQDKYQIFSEKKGWLGLSGTQIILLDKESGESWLYDNGKWQLIAKVSEELAAKKAAASVKAKLEEQINQLKAKQAEEIKSLKVKQEAELKAAVAKLGDQEQQSLKRFRAVAEQSQQVTKVKAEVPNDKKVTAAPPIEEEETGEDSQPDWLK